MSNKKNREIWIDIARGILIILVVMGHSVSGPYYDLDKPTDYVYLFHMPAFFIISGYLYKNSNLSLESSLKKRFKRLITPYITYLLVINIPILMLTYINTKSIDLTLSILKNTILGGQYLNVYSGVLWFITCLLFTEIFFILCDNFFYSKIIKISIIVLCYTLAHIQAWYFRGSKLPFAIDITLISIAYFAVGIYLKKYIINKYTFVITTIITFISLVFIKFKIINYGLELWGHHNLSYTLDFIIPVSISLMIFNICKYIEDKSRILKEIGKYTLPIMCLHIPLNTIILNVLGINVGSKMYIILYSIFGVIIPYIITKYIFLKSQRLKKLFIG